MSAFSDKLKQAFANIYDKFVDVDNKVEDIKNSSASGLSTELKTRYDTTTLQAMYNEVIEPSPEKWFTFDSEAQTITGLNEEYVDEYSSADVTKLVVPYSIDSVIVKKIGTYAFFPMTGDAWTTTIPSTVNDVRLPNCIDSIGDGAFSNAPIKSVNIPTSCYMIGDYAFEFCQSLEEVITPIKPNWELKIGSGAFHDCQSLRNIDTIIDGTKEIPHAAFSYTGIENVIIPESVDAIGYYAFKLSSLRNITFLNKNCILDDNWCDTEYLELIKGYKGSTAETYAKNNGIPFMSIEGTEVLDKQPSDFIINVAQHEIGDTDVPVETDTTFDEVLEAHNNGKNVKVLLDDIYILPLSFYSSNSFSFYIAHSNGSMTTVTCKKNNGWSLSHSCSTKDVIDNEFQIREGELIEVLDEIIYNQENNPDVYIITPDIEPNDPNIDFGI